MVNLQRLSDEELSDLGFDLESDDPDNPGVAATLGGLDPYAHQTKSGRPVISYEQFVAMQKLDYRLEPYEIRMVDRFGQVHTRPATKFLKYWGEGLRPITKDMLKPKPKAQAVDSVAVYRCDEKYPECPRFFDSAKGREMHWGMEHEKKWSKKQKKD